MAYYIFHIPTNSFPIRLTKISDSVFCFQSKEINKSSDYEMHQHCLCLAVKEDSDSILIKTLKDFIIVLNIFNQEESAIKWFSERDLKKYKAIDDSIENIYSLYNSDERFAGYSEDFDDMTFHVPIFPHPRFSFIDIFNKLHSLSESDFVYKSFSFLAIISPVRMFTHKIFDNALHENAMHFQLFEAIMNQYDPNNKEIQSQCPTCERPKQRGINRRIKDFFNLDEYKSIKDKQDIIDSIIKIAETRNKFSHNLKGKSSIEYHNDIIEKLGYNTTFYLKEDIKYTEGTSQAQWNIKIVNTLVLINKLSKAQA